jgi:hypothetical protein
MSKYLVHHLTNGTPVGVWNSDKKNFYAPDQGRHEEYGKAVLQGADFSKWEDILDTWDGRQPNGRARWTAYETEETKLEAVYAELANEYLD